MSQKNELEWPEALAAELKAKQEQVLAKKQDRLDLLKGELKIEKSLVDARTRRMTSDLWDIYPINEFPDRRGYSICDIHLPSSEHLEKHDGTMISVAIGYVGHLLLLLSEVLDITLRFPLKHLGSKSLIFCSRRNQYFPLYVDSAKSREWVNFVYGMNLLNLDIMQIRTLYGLHTHEPDDTLANLHELMLYLAGGS